MMVDKLVAVAQAKDTRVPQRIAISIQYNMFFSIETKQNTIQFIT